MPWIAGPRVCPGKKFSHVEYAAVLSTLLSKFDIKPAKFGAGMTANDASEALHRTVEDVYFNLTPKMKNPGKCGVEFVPRHHSAKGQ